MRYYGLEIGYDYSFGRIDKAAVRYFYIIYDSIRLLGDDLLNNVVAGEVYIKPVVRYTRCEF